MQLLFFCYIINACVSTAIAVISHSIDSTELERLQNVAARSAAPARTVKATHSTAALVKPGLSHQDFDLETNTHIDVRFYQGWGNV